jgi:cytochrome c5
MTAAAVATPAEASHHRSGAEIVQGQCAICHGPGANGAPRIGDRKAWAPRASRGLTSLSKNAVAGIRNMPAHGGNPGLSDLEIQRAITWMVNASGGRWSEPIDPAATLVERTGPTIVAAHCSACHATGVGGAPAIGDRTAWVPRLKNGLNVLARSAAAGHGGMPPRGGVANLTDKELVSAIEYMLNPVAPVPQMTSAAPAPLEPNHRSVAGTEIYFGAVSTDAIRGQHKGRDSESMMHGGIPREPDTYHVNISLFDSATRAAIKDARVEARVTDPVRGDQVKLLEPMVFNEMVSYGNYFRIPERGTHTIAVVVHRANGTQDIETTFDFKRAP